MLLKLHIRNRRQWVSKDLIDFSQPTEVEVLSVFSNLCNQPPAV